MEQEEEVIPAPPTTENVEQSKKQDIFQQAAKVVSREQMLNIIEKGFQATLKTLFGEYMNVDQVYLALTAMKGLERRLKRWARKQ